MITAQICKTTTHFKDKKWKYTCMILNQMVIYLRSKQQQTGLNMNINLIYFVTYTIYYTDTLMSDTSTAI